MIYDNVIVTEDGLFLKKRLRLSLTVLQEVGEAGEVTGITEAADSDTQSCSRLPHTGTKLSWRKRKQMKFLGTGILMKNH